MRKENQSPTGARDHFERSEKNYSATESVTKKSATVSG